MTVHQVDNIDQREEDDNILLELEKDDDALLASIREKRLNQLKKEFAERESLRAREHGTYSEIPTEKEVIQATLQSKYCVIHFYHADFRRCLIMDKHLKELARTHFHTKFAKAEVEKCPFLVEKLKIQVLPCVICFVDGISVDRIIGFEELGNSDEFETRNLEKRLGFSGVIKLKHAKNQFNFNAKNKSIRSSVEQDDIY